jgi:predicted O-methyltransferase YrrM
MRPTFSRDFMADKTGPWLEHVVPRFAGLPGRRWVEVGSYEGCSTLWTLDHVLTGLGSLIYCVDVFDSEKSMTSLWGNTDYPRLFAENTADRPNVVALQGWSHEILPRLSMTRFHGAYLDGGHEESIVIRDLELIWPLLDLGAVVVVDDYGWEGSPGTKVAVDNFLRLRGAEARLLHASFQAVLLKG